jgi:hypothetical protein
VAKTEGKGIFVYGDGPDDRVPANWRLTAGKRLSSEDSWRAEITTIRSASSETVASDILGALVQEFVFKLETDDGMVYPCGICDLEYIADAYSTAHFEICSRDQNMARLVVND